jgi:hypothetical protein
MTSRRDKNRWCQPKEKADSERERKEEKEKKKEQMYTQKALNKR